MLDPHIVLHEDHLERWFSIGVGRVVVLAMSLSAKKETLIIITVAAQEKEVLGRDLLTDPSGWFNLLIT